MNYANKMKVTATINMNKINAFMLTGLTIIAPLSIVALFPLPSQARDRCQGLWQHLDPTMQCQVTEFSSRTPVPSTGAYVRRDNRPEVYALHYSSKTACHVQNSSQMEVFGGFKQVRTMSSDPLSGSKFVGECRWSNGLYRLRNKPEVYALYDNGSPSACWVRTSEKVNQLGGWGRVKLVDDLSDIKAGRQYFEKC
jgi:hypothetical protein